MIIRKLRHLFVPQHTNNFKAKILHSHAFLVLVGLFCFTQAAISFITINRPDILGYASQMPPSLIVELTNKRRVESGLPALVINEKLSDAARRKAADMFQKDYWSHNAPDGTKPWYFITSSNYNYLHAGENLARDFTDGDKVVQAWVNSPSHRENLLSNRFREIGVAVVDGKLGGQETTLIVQMFGTPQSGSPEVGSAGQVVRQAQAAEQVQGDQVTDTALPAPTPEALVTPYVPGNVPLVNTFVFSRSVSASFAVLILAVLIIDWLVAWRQNIVRLSGKNWAHITLVSLTLVLAFLINQGLII